MGQPIENGVSPDPSDIGSRATILPTLQEGAPWPPLNCEVNCVSGPDFY